MQRGVFVTGTDTGVGKSRVAAALAHVLQGRGLRVRSRTPVGHGCHAGPDGLVQLHAACLSGVGSGDFVLVEGTGGFCSALARHVLNADLASGLGLPVLVVAADRPGTLNHALLTVEAVRLRGLALAGLVLNQPLPRPVAAMDSAAELARWLRMPVVSLPHDAGAGSDVWRRDAARLAPLVDPWFAEAKETLH